MGDEPGVEAHAHDPSTKEMKAGRPGVQGQSWLCNAFEDSVGYVRPYF